MTTPSEGSVSMDLFFGRLVDDALERALPAIASAVAERMTGGAPWCLLTVADVAERFGRSERWVRERVKRGDLPCVRLDGGGPGFLQADLEAFAEARRVPGRDG